MGSKTKYSSNFKKVSTLWTQLSWSHISTAFNTVSFTPLHIRLIKCRPCRAMFAALSRRFNAVSFTSLHIRLIKCRPCRAGIVAFLRGNNIFSKSRRDDTLLTVGATYGQKATALYQSRRDDTYNLFTSKINTL